MPNPPNMQHWITALMGLILGSAVGELRAQGGIGLEAPPPLYTEVERSPVWPGCESEPGEKGDPWKAEKECTLSAIQAYFDQVLKLEGLDRYEPIPEMMLISFTVTDTGEWKDFEILRGEHAPVEDQIRLVMSGVPVFQPAVHQEQLVHYRFQIPLRLKAKK